MGIFFYVVIAVLQMFPKLEEEVVAQPHNKWCFTFLCYQEIILCNLESCSREVWMGAFLSTSLHWTMTENLPAFTIECYITLLVLIETSITILFVEGCTWVEEPNYPRSLCPDFTMLCLPAIVSSLIIEWKYDKFYMCEYVIKMSKFFHTKSSNSYRKIFKNLMAMDKNIFFSIIKMLTMVIGSQGKLK